jgi:hypothetical protein
LRIVPIVFPSTSTFHGRAWREWLDPQPLRESFTVADIVITFRLLREQPLSQIAIDRRLGDPLLKLREPECELR